MEVVFPIETLVRKSTRRYHPECENKTSNRGGSFDVQLSQSTLRRFMKNITQIKVCVTDASPVCLLALYTLYCIV
jgi:hypothetical protein